MLILGPKPCFLRPTIFKIPQLNWYYHPCKTPFQHLVPPAHPPPWFRHPWLDLDDDSHSCHAEWFIFVLPTPPAENCRLRLCPEYSWGITFTLYRIFVACTLNLDPRVQSLFFIINKWNCLPVYKAKLPFRKLHEEVMSPDSFDMESLS